MNGRCNKRDVERKLFKQKTRKRRWKFTRAEWRVYNDFVELVASQIVQLEQAQVTWSRDITRGDGRGGGACAHCFYLVNCYYNIIITIICCRRLYGRSLMICRRAAAHGPKTTVTAVSIFFALLISFFFRVFIEKKKLFSPKTRYDLDQYTRTAVISLRDACWKNNNDKMIIQTFVCRAGRGLYTIPT